MSLERELHEVLRLRIEPIGYTNRALNWDIFVSAAGDLEYRGLNEQPHFMPYFISQTHTFEGFEDVIEKLSAISQFRIAFCLDYDVGRQRVNVGQSNGSGLSPKILADEARGADKLVVVLSHEAANWIRQNGHNIQNADRQYLFFDETNEGIAYCDRVQMGGRWPDLGIQESWGLSDDANFYAVMWRPFVHMDPLVALPDTLIQRK